MTHVNSWMWSNVTLTLVYRDFTQCYTCYSLTLQCACNALPLQLLLLCRKCRREVHLTSFIWWRVRISTYINSSAVPDGSLTHILSPPGVRRHTVWLERLWGAQSDTATVRDDTCAVTSDWYMSLTCKTHGSDE